MATFSCFTPTKKMDIDPRRQSMATPSHTPREGVDTNESPSLFASSPRLKLSFEQDQSFDSSLFTEEDMKNFLSFKKSKSERDLEASEPLLASRDEPIIDESDAGEEVLETDLTMNEFLRQDSQSRPVQASQSANLQWGMPNSQSATFTALPTAPTMLDLQAAASSPSPTLPQSRPPQAELASRKHKRKNISLSLPMRSVKRVLTGRSTTGNNTTTTRSGLRRLYKRDEPSFEMLTPRNRASADISSGHRQTDLTAFAADTQRVVSTSTSAGAEAEADAGRSASGRRNSGSATQRHPSDTNKQLPLLSESSRQEVNNYVGAPTFAPPLATPTLANIQSMHASPANPFVRPRAPSRSALSSHIEDLLNHISDLNLENQILRDQVSLVRRDWVDTAGSLDLERHRSFTAEMECFRRGVRVEELEGEIRRLKRGSDLV